MSLGLPESSRRRRLRLCIEPRAKELGSETQATAAAATATAATATASAIASASASASASAAGLIHWPQELAQTRQELPAEEQRNGSPELLHDFEVLTLVVRLQVPLLHQVVVLCRHHRDV